MLFYHQGTNRLVINSHMKNFPWSKGKKPQKEFLEMTKEKSLSPEPPSG